jgi:hypothetical protein
MACLSAGHIDQVREFNQRISGGGWGEYQLPCSVEIFEASRGSPVEWEGWLALEGEMVRGGYLLKRQEFSFFGEPRPTGSYQISVSEGIIDRRFFSVGVKMLNHALSRTPLLFALGMGGRDRPLPRFLAAFGWKLHDVPFLFRILRPARVLRNLPTLRATPLRRFLLDAAAASGLGAAGLHLAQSGRFWRNRKLQAVYAEVAEFGGWADDLWQACNRDYSMIACRGSLALNTLYPASFERLHRLQVSSGAEVVGWAVVRHTRMQGHKQFGDLYVGSVIDCLSAPRNAPAVVNAATRFLENRGVDLIVSNQASQAWERAMRNAGYLRGPSNFILAASKALSKLLDPFERNVAAAHMNRGDGDGPIHL